MLGKLFSGGAADLVKGVGGVKTHDESGTRGSQS